MTSFLLSRGAPTGGPSTDLGGASYAGPAELLSRRDGRFAIFVGSLDAAHSRLTYDPGTGRIEIESDPSGQLALRYAFVGGAVHVASDDLGLAPHVPFAVDETSLDHVRAVGWSVGGRSLVEGIAVCPAGERVVVTDRARSLGPPRFPKGGDPVDAALAYMARRLPAGRVAVELSAGFDSRAALAATLASKEARDVVAFSEGPADSRDVVVAAEICRRHGIRFERRETAKRAPDDVLRDWTDAAAAFNGHIDVNVLASWGRPAGLTVCGDGGEISRGHYDPFVPFRAQGTRPSMTAQDAIANRYGSSRRLRDAIDRVSPGADGESEIMDRFYLAERFGVWNQKLARGWDRRISPFYATGSMSRLGRGRASRLHVDLIRTHLPTALGLPINGEAPPSLYGGGPMRMVARDAWNLMGKVGRRVARRLGGAADLESARDATMAETLADLPGGFLHAPATGWPELGAQRFLAIYRDAATAHARGRPAAVTRSPVAT